MKNLSHFNPTRSLRDRRAMTLVELSLTLALLLVFASVVAFSLSGMTTWKLGRRASVNLQSVYLAQKSFLADHPTRAISSITEAELAPYLPSTLTSVPTVESLEGTQLSIDVTVMPPVVSSGGGGVYDPSGDSDDALWDVGSP